MLYMFSLVDYLNFYNNKLKLDDLVGMWKVGQMYLEFNKFVSLT